MSNNSLGVFVAALILLLIANNFPTSDSVLIGFMIIMGAAIIATEIHASKKN